MRADGDEPVGARVRITHPRTDAVRRRDARPAVREIDEQTHLGEVYMRALLRSQRRLAVLVCLVTSLLLGGIALAFAFEGSLARARLLGVPVPWVVLGVLVYPCLIGLAVYTVGQAERTERDFTALLRDR